MDNTPISHLRKRILQHSGKVPSPKTRKFVRPAELADSFPKTHSMKLLEYEHNTTIDKIIFKGSLNEVVNFVHNRVDRSTISKWRKHVLKYMPELEDTDYV
jgi:hypothetical protein